MAFQNLRTGSTVYIFHKDNSPKLEIGQVIAEPKIRQKYPIPTPGQPYAGFIPQQQEQVVDLSIKIGDKVQPIEGLTPSTDIQDCGNGSGTGGYRDDDDEDYNERRGVPGTGRYGRRRYGRGRRY